ncbi:glutathione S-transferase 1-1-like [Acyrthosiphon pisum]|uniref:Uncharacterized protein n=1 Tax=Acyrthosiphon pisum TaxID=7029 RepID=A0A8R2JTG2_ACYPI|nr:glutathione S-transferase 1-1-like [Acyrthosiphon pisum]
MNLCDALVDNVFEVCARMKPRPHRTNRRSRKEINLYYDLQSRPCRAVLLTLEALNLQFNLKHIRLLGREQLKEDFLKINSLHTLPVIEDGDFVLVDSHAIIVYLVRKYGGKDDNPLYPNNPKLQAQVNQMLHFDNGTLFPAFTIQYACYNNTMVEIIDHILIDGQTGNSSSSNDRTSGNAYLRINEYNILKIIPDMKYDKINGWIYFRKSKTDEREEKIHEALQFLENVLKKSPWSAGESMTVADFSLIATITTLKVAGVKMEKYDKINEWVKSAQLQWSDTKRLTKRESFLSKK